MSLNYYYRRKINRRKSRPSQERACKYPRQSYCMTAAIQLSTLLFHFVPSHEANLIVPAGCGTGAENLPEATDPVAELRLLSCSFLIHRSMNSSAVKLQKATDLREIHQVIATQQPVLRSREVRESFIPAQKLQFRSSPLLLGACDRSYGVMSREREHRTGNVVF